MLIKNDASPVMFPLLNPYGHVVFQAQRGDVHTVVVNGRVVKYDHQLVGDGLGKARAAIEQTVDYLRGELGPEAWSEGMHPEIPETRVLDNPYTYTGAEQWKSREDQLSTSNSALSLSPAPFVSNLPLSLKPFSSVGLAPSGTG